MKKDNLMKTASLLFVSALIGTNANAQDLPTMGWSSWNTYALNVNETTVKEQAMAMKKNGFLKVGYNHINIDDGYFGGRDAKTGNLIINKKRFPNGLQTIVKYIHALGEKAGIYSDGGKHTCGSYHGGDKDGDGVGLYGYDQRDCDFFFKECGFDFIKVDFCGGVSYHNREGLDLDAEKRYKEIAKAIANTGRDDVRLNICRWDYPGNWAHDIATSWRTTGDINASWGSVRDILLQNLYLSAYCYGGHFNDMDMLEVGRGLSKEEDRTHFGMWCIMSSPLLIGCSMNGMNTETSLLLRNPELIALNQDPLRIQAYVAKRVGDTYVLVKDIETLYGKTRAVAFFNPSDKAAEMSIDFSEIDLAGNVKVRDLYEKKDLDDASESFSVKVPAHGTRIYRFEAETRLERTVYEGETAYLSQYQEIFNNQAKETAIYESNAAASGGMVAGWLGRRAANDLQWRNVYSDNGGEYTLSIKYVSGESRSMTVNVNGKDIKTLSCNSGGWGTVGTQMLKVTLLPGDNIVRLYNKSGWMPSIDCMQVKSTTSAKPLVVGVERVEMNRQKMSSDTNYYSLSGRRIAKPVRGVYVHNGKKHIKK